MSRPEVLVFGAGPAGMTAAVAAARAGAAVTLVEKTDAPGKKLSMTGNGRGNVSNLLLTPEAYNRAARGRMGGWLSRWGREETVAFLRSIGIYTRPEGDGIYPLSGQATSLVRGLVEACARHGVRQMLGCQLKSLERRSGSAGFVCIAGGRPLRGRSVILATGGLSGPVSCQATGDAYYLLEKLGIACVPRHPALVPLSVCDPALPEKKGIRARAAVSFYTVDGEVPEAEPGEDSLIASEYGEVQLASGMLSGIPVLQASGRVAEACAAGKRVVAYLDFFPELTRAEWRDRTEALESLGSVSPEERAVWLLGGLCNEEVARLVLRRMGITAAEGGVFARLSEGQRRRLWRLLRSFPLEIRGAGEYARAQATAGGAALAEVDGDLQSRRVPGLYIAGELLDVDGRCGGYNLQWAFTSGWIAGCSAAGARPAQGMGGA